MHESPQAFEVAEARFFWTSQSCFLSSNWFFEGEYLFTDKPMVITKPTVKGARGLGSKLYPSNMQRMLKMLLVSCRVFLE